ncbi:MAG: N-acetylmuramoyl-L-alanine amidase [Roseobacter sp.]
MIRIFALCVVLWAACNVPSLAQEIPSFARVDAAESHISKGRGGRVDIALHLTQGVPFRVFTLDAPARLVLDFRDTDWSDVQAETLLDPDAGVVALRFGPFQPGWSRLVADLGQPMLPRDVDMRVDLASGQAVLALHLEPVAQEAFAAASGVPQNVPRPSTPQAGVAPVSDDRFVIVLDPGHGGIDPGAERDGLSEKELMLEFAFELRAHLLAREEDVDVVLTREADVFVSLDTRVAHAHQAGGDLFVSLHADALSQGGAQGATIYLLSDEASDAATAHLAARHNRADVLAGLDLSGSDDVVTSLLLDLARRETEPRSKALAHAFIEGMAQSGGPMNSRPLRHAGFAVLKSADIPSVLVEVGFLSSPRDLANLRDPAWRRGMVAAMGDAILHWQAQDSQRQALLRK